MFLRPHLERDRSYKPVFADPKPTKNHEVINFNQGGPGGGGGGGGSGRGGHRDGRGGEHHRGVASLRDRGGDEKYLFSLLLKT